LKRLLCWDESRRENPLSPPQATFTFGDPGGGKTFTAHGLIREAAELAKRKGLPFWAFPLSITDIGSKYQNESPQKLNEYIEQIVAFPGAVAMYIADADAVIPSRENQHATPEDIKLAGVFFSMFDGSRIPKGKFLPIMDANFTDNMGEALKSRIMSAQLLELKRFASADEFSKYAKGYMTRGGAVVGVTEDGWNEIGQYLINSKLNNREISNLLNDLRSKFDVPDDLIDKDFDAKVKFRNEYLKGIDKAKILGVFDKFVETQMEIKRASYDARQRHAMDQFRIDLATPKNKGSKRVVGAA
jgi:hypothetical protein